MNDVFHEQLIVRKKTSGEKAKQVLMIVGGVLLGLATFFIPVLNTLGPVLLILAIWGAIYLSRNYNVEYEYAVTNYYLDIDKIVAQRKRSRVVSLDIRKIDYFISSKDSGMFNAQKNDKSIVQSFDCTSNKGEENVYAIITNLDGKKTRILFEPNDEIVEAIRKFLQKKPYQIYR
ncbi:DUF6106 family protein [Caldicellulosiruptor morganii]|uniref:DUF6106 family protein n=1 Tax=Caldicellulosiruptor morganii TaxID=1387555 RepID=A0ABY7BJN5_9FIRM|nr:DUF6106 family protein [Caldicellulosiruptor morganii]WAM33025.1 DUF6106 family protein [Caldicellulosiruptor morganii]